MEQINIPKDKGVVLVEGIERGTYYLVSKSNNNIYKPVYTFKDVYCCSSVDYIEDKDLFVVVTREFDNDTYLRLITRRGYKIGEFSAKSIINLRNGAYYCVGNERYFYDAISNNFINLESYIRYGCNNESLYDLKIDDVSLCCGAKLDDGGRYYEILISVLDEVVSCAISVDKDSLLKMYPFVVSEKDGAVYPLGDSNEFLTVAEFGNKFAKTQLAVNLNLACQKNKEEKGKREEHVRRRVRSEISKCRQLLKNNEL